MRQQLLVPRPDDTCVAPSTDTSPTGQQQVKLLALQSSYIE